jgi:multiple sugar transport system permease protein
MTDVLTPEHPGPSGAARRRDRAAAVTSRRTKPVAERRKSLAAHVVLVVLAVYFLVPLWWLLVASSKSTTALFSSAPLWFDKHISWGSNLLQLVTFNDSIYLRWLGNSALYAVVGGLGSTVVAVLAGYGFAKFAFPGRNFMFAVLLGSVMVPLTALVIPTFILFSNVGLVDTMWAVILPSLLNPFGVYLMRVYIADAVPVELLDAARIDGASEIRTFLFVALPLMKPATVTVLLLSIVANWNNYFLPLTMLTSNQRFPITVGLGQWMGLATANAGGGPGLWALIIGGSLVSIIPLIVAFLTMQKYWQGGLSLGSLK